MPKKNDKKWTGNVTYRFIELTLLSFIKMFLTEHFVIYSIGNTWLWDLHLQYIC